MKNNWKKAELIIVIIIIIGLIILLNLKINQSTEVKNDAYILDYIIENEDGTKVNTSKKLIEARISNGIKVEKVQLTTKQNGKAQLIAQVTNNTEEDIDVQVINIILYDFYGNEIKKINAAIGATKVGQTSQLEAEISLNIEKVADYNIEIK